MIFAPKLVLELAIDLDRYFSEAAAMGVSREMAEAVLLEEMKKSQASLTISTKAAMGSARRRLPQISFIDRQS